jgi:hypothetical protein
MRTLSAVVFVAAALWAPAVLADQTRATPSPALQGLGRPTLEINGDGRAGMPYFVSRPRVVFSGTVSGQATAVEIVDGSTTIARLENPGRRWTTTVKGMAPGLHQIRVYPIDATGERGPSTKVHKLVISVPEILPLEETIAAGGGFQLEGLSRNGNLGLSTAAVGDLNGDDVEDIALVEPNASFPTAEKGGAVHIVFGSADLTETPPNLASLVGTNGFRIEGAARGQRPRVVAPAGDVNGDGFDDLLIASEAVGKGYEDAPSWVSVIFGRGETFPAIIPLADAVPQYGVRFEAPPAENLIESIAGGGDINADGVADVAIGVWNAECPAVYVIYGQVNDGIPPVTLIADLDLTRGFALNKGCGTFAHSLAFTGDLNGDLVDDLAVGDTSMYNDSVSVIFGRTTRKAFMTDVSKMGLATGFQVVDNGAGIGIGNTLSGGGDLDGDGLDDLAIGAEDWGAPIVLRGRNGAFPRRVLQRSLNRTEGIIFSNQSSMDRAENQVALSGDFDGDGLTDLVISTEEFRRTWGNWGPRGSSIFVVYGRRKLFPTFNPVEGIGPAAGLRIDTPLEDGPYVLPVTMADMNADGLGDVIISSPFSDRGRKGSGLIHVVFGRPRSTTK